MSSVSYLILSLGKSWSRFGCSQNWFYMREDRGAKLEAF